MGIRRSLTLLVAGTLIPLLAFSAVATYRSGHEKDAAAERALLDAARTLVVALDKHFEGSITTLRALGTSEYLDAGDLAAFYRQCRLALPVREEWRAISLFDSTGRRLFISTEPFGAALPGPPATMTGPFRRLVEARTAGVSDLFRSPLTNRYAMSVGVPILRGGEVRWVLSAGMTPDTLGKLVTSDRTLSGSTATVFDRGYR